MHEVTITVNGTPQTHTIEPRELLVSFLRDRCGLTGTNVGCDTSSCGACTVLVDGRSVKSCTVLALQVDGCDATTVEGLERDGHLHPIQQAFHEEHALQCGFCTPGMMLAAVSLIAQDPELEDETEIRTGLEGNICRCTGYHNIVKAVQSAARAMRDADPEEAR